MTEVIETMSEQETERAERPVLRRTFKAEVTEGDGRTVDVRIVPYGEIGLADDGYGGVPKGIIYREEYVAGAFSHQVNAANRVLVNFEHQGGIAGVVGHGTTLRDSPVGFFGSFRLHDTPDGDKALLLVREGVLDGVSLEAVPMKNVRTAEGVVRRVKAHLRNIALCRDPAYAGARVLAVREQANITLDEEMLPLAPDPELIERCRSLGIRMPQRYNEAHPAETDTPSNDEGTSEDGTRPETT